ncbi:MAG: hypothetical protein SFV15_19205 [Polyangiaceae bacterium]|nr:hypothetical protein [Polyangiaceae bacterium]
MGLPLPLIERLRRALLFASLVAGIYVFANVVDDHYPIKEWLFFRYAGYWGAVLFWALGVVSFGNRVVRRVLPGLPGLEHGMLSFGTGVLSFVVAMAAAGFLQLYQPWLFWALPFAFFLIGLPNLWQLFSELKRAFIAEDWFGGKHWLRPFAILFGFAAFGMIYFVILTPKNIQYDSYWKHMTLAEDFVAHGGVRRFPEGWIFASRPHSTSFLYAWAFLAPVPKLFDRMELCAHLEFVVFSVTTLVGIPAIVRRLAPRADARATWAARFLFPGVFLYDSSLSGGADHFGAMYGPIIFLLTLRALPNLSLTACAYLGAFLGGALMLKETVGLMLIPFPVACLLTRWIWLTGRGLFGQRALANSRVLILAPVCTVLAALVVSSPFWLKNLSYYGDPFYPLLHRFFHSTPFSEASAYRLEWGHQAEQSWKPPRTWEGLLLTLRALFTFSFIPNNWAQMHGAVPVFGSLFTLLLGPLVFVRRARLVWWVVAWVHLGIFAWFWTHHQDRYLQAILPLMAAATAAALALIWGSSGWLVRAACALLVAFQIVWGGDVYFIQTHAMVGSPVKVVLDLLNTGFKKNYRDRFEISSRPNAVSARLPAGARVLLHEDHIGLGMQAELVHDFTLWQYGINYGELKDPKAVYELLQHLGVTHIYRHSGKFFGADTVAGDLMFFNFVNFHTKKTESVGNVLLSEMPERAPFGPFNDNVVVLSCGQGYLQGAYRVRDLNAPSVGPKARAFPAPRQPLDGDAVLAMVPRAGFVVVDPTCSVSLPAELGRDFLLLTQHPAFAKGRAYDIYGRKP